MIAALILTAAIGAPLKGTYVPPPTPTPQGRPGRIECWQPDNLNYLTGPAPMQVFEPHLWCCYQWRGGFLDDSGQWVFLQCVSR